MSHSRVNNIPKHFGPLVIAITKYYLSVSIKTDLQHPISTALYCR